MKIRYDPSVDAAYISFKEDKAEVTTVRLTQDIAVDFGPNEEVFGIEILDASRHLGFKAGEPSITLENLMARANHRSIRLDKLEAMRKRYPKAYEKWTAEEEALLRKHFQDGRNIAELAQLLQRQPSAIESRLRRLGLTQ